MQSAGSRIAVDKVQRREPGWGTFRYAHRTDTGAPVSVWMYEDDVLAAGGGPAVFRDGASPLVQLRHPSLVPVREITPEGWVVLDPLVGETLSARIQAKALDEVLLARLMKDVARLLRTYEERGHAHLALHADRIILDDSGNARVIDLGERLIPVRSAEASACCAPEAATRARPATVAADVYSLGMVALKAAIGNRASPELSSDEIEALGEESGLSNRFIELVQRCLGKGAESRPRPLDLLDMLDSITARSGRLRRKARTSDTFPRGDPLYPFPIATWVQRLRSVERGSTAESHALEHVYLTGLRFLVYVALADALPIARSAMSSAVATPALRGESTKLLQFLEESGSQGLAGFRRKIAHGHLLALLHRCSAVLASSSEECFVPELRAFLSSRKTPPLLEELLRMRNDAKHDRAAPAVRELRGKVKEFLGRIMFFDAYPLVALGRASVQGGVYTYDALVLSGATFPFERSPVEATSGVESGRVYMIDPSRTRLLPLDPFYVCLTCAGPCNEIHLYALQDIERRGATLVPTDPAGASHVRYEPDMVERIDSLITGSAQDAPGPRGIKLRRLSIALTPAPTEGPVELAHGEVVGDCKIHRRLDEATHGHVYEANDLRTGEPVALKLLTQRDAQERLRVSWEAAGHARLAHPNVVRVIRSGTAEGQRYLVLELAPGWNVGGKVARDLAGTLALQKKPLNVDIAVSVGIQLLEALGYLHDMGIVHRDVAPGNVLLFDRGRIKLSDFGIARFPTGGLGRTLVTVGTPEYMAPEQVQGEEEVDGRADLYSVGAILFEMLAGRPPFRKPSRIATMAAHVDEPLPSLRALNPRVSEAVEEVIRQALRKNRAERPKNALRFIRLLELATRGLSDTANLERAELELSGVRAVPPREHAKDLVRQLDTKDKEEEEQTSADIPSSAGIQETPVVLAFGRMDESTVGDLTDEGPVVATEAHVDYKADLLMRDAPPETPDPAIPAFANLIFVLEKRVIPVPIDFTQTLTVGRSRSRDIQISSNKVSRLQAIVGFDRGTFCVRHMGARNATRANGIELARDRTFVVPNGGLLDFAGTLAWIIAESPPALALRFDKRPLSTFVRVLEPRHGARVQQAVRGGARAWAALLCHVGFEGAALFQQKALGP